MFPWLDKGEVDLEKDTRTVLAYSDAKIDLDQQEEAATALETEKLTEVLVDCIPEVIIQFSCPHTQIDLSIQLGILSVILVSKAVLNHKNF